jgi:hypothetical protein
LHHDDGFQHCSGQTLVGGDLSILMKTKSLRV